MPFTLAPAANPSAAQPLQRFRATVPRHGVWEGEVSVAGELDMDQGSPVALTLGDTQFLGYVVAGGTFPGASESTYTLAGGAAGWTKQVQERGVSVPGGVKLFDVLSQLAQDAGELFDMTTVSASAVLGDHWQRMAGAASSALWALFPLGAGGWRVDPDGKARPGPRPPAPIALQDGVDFVVESAPQGQRRATIGSAGDNVGAFLPGAVVTAATLASPIVVGELTVRGTHEEVHLDLLGEGGLLEQLAALVQAVLPPPPLTGVYRYQVAEADAGTPNLKALTKGVPPVLSCQKVYGLPGVTTTLAAGTVVLVAFLDGSQARPAVVGYLSGVNPGSVEIDAGTFTVGGATAINLGGTSALALAQPIIGWAAGVNLALIAAGHPVPALSGTVSSTIVKGA